MKKLLLSTIVALTLVGTVSAGHAEENWWDMKDAYSVMQAGVGFGHKDYKESGVFNLGLGYHMNRHFRGDITVGARAFGKVKTEGEEADSWSIPALANLYMNIPWQNLGLYAMGGLGMSYNKVDGTSLTKSDGKMNFAWTLGAGIDYRLNRCWSLDLGYRYVDLGEASADFKDGSGKAKTDMRSHDILLSARYYF